MPNLKTQLESVLFIAARPMSLKKLAETLACKIADIEPLIEELAADYKANQRGFRLIRSGSEVQMSTAPESAQLIQDFLKDETTGELSRPSLETLSIVAYRGPLTKGELELIRGVNCSLILRNLIMHGLVDVKGEAADPKSTYQITGDFLRFLGVTNANELPDYDKLRSHETLVKALEKI